MFQPWHLIVIFFTFNTVNGLSRSFSAGGVGSMIIANGFSVRQDYNRLYCGSLTCTGAVNCEILKYGSKVTEKCTNNEKVVVDQKTYDSYSSSDDLELYFGPAYAQQSAEESRRITAEVNDHISNVFRNINNNWRHNKSPSDNDSEDDQDSNAPDNVLDFGPNLSQKINDLVNHRISQAFEKVLLRLENRK